MALQQEQSVSDIQFVLDQLLTKLENSNSLDEKIVATENESSSICSTSSGSESDSDDSTSSSSSWTSGSSSSLTDQNFIDSRSEGTREKEPKQQLKVKGELTLHDLPLIESLEISVPEDERLEQIGVIKSCVDILVVIESMPNSPPLNIDSVLFSKDRTSIGKVFEIFGPVVHPFYSIRFNSKADIKDAKLSVGQKIFYAPNREALTQFVFTKDLEKHQGCDASWEHDIEPPPDQLDYSDDEKEKQARRQSRKSGDKRSLSENQNTDNLGKEFSDENIRSSPQNSTFAGNHRRDHKQRRGRGRYQRNARNKTTACHPRGSNPFAFSHSPADGRNQSPPRTQSYTPYLSEQPFSGTAGLYMPNINCLDVIESAPFIRPFIPPPAGPLTIPPPSNLSAFTGARPPIGHFSSQMPQPPVMPSRPFHPLLRPGLHRLPPQQTVNPSFMFGQQVATTRFSGNRQSLNNGNDNNNDDVINMSSKNGNNESNLTSVNNSTNSNAVISEKKPEKIVLVDKRYFSDSD